MFHMKQKYTLDTRDVAQMSAAEIIALLQPPRPKPASKIEHAKLLIQNGALKGATAKKLGLSHWQVQTRMRDVTSAKRQAWHDAIAFWLRPGRIEWLIKKWNAGYSGSLIAEEIGVSPNTILGKVKRIRESGAYMRSGAPMRSKRKRVAR